jgi:hypothetical protein
MIISSNKETKDAYPSPLNFEVLSFCVKTQKKYVRKHSGIPSFKDLSLLMKGREGILFLKFKQKIPQKFN